ncbi:MAG: hypothetical protein AMJ84_07180 [Acidithiobacillales bacterium SM23_46]|jgi:outer membrane lipoprotein|nr:MAG: hypothetical protein AMJ84_07180 [Acidithiobacillales bacterium SM23_46]
MNSMCYRWFLIGFVLLLSACASTVPEDIRKETERVVHIGEARQSPATFRGSEVRWGGTIASVRNERDATLIEIVSRRLDSDGQPYEEDRSEGRFLARAAGFLDPALYSAGREVTVRGRLDGVREEAIGEFRYTFPLVAADHVYLWPKRPPPQPAYPYDPFWYYPWYPWGWPYYQPYYPPPHHH